MNSIYNKILNEVYLIQDFNSWDNSEQTFKDNLVNSLKTKEFVYSLKTGVEGSKGYKTVPHSSEVIKLIYEWTFFENCKIMIMSNGKKIHKDVKLRDIQGELFKCDIIGIDNLKTISIIFENLEDFEQNIKNKECALLFYECDLVSLPAFDTSRAKTMQQMFDRCIFLKECPEFNTRNVEDMRWMFSECFSLVSVPKLDITSIGWSVGYNGDPGMREMFELCPNLDEVTRKLWNPNSGGTPSPHFN